MSVNVGTATGYLDLDIAGFLAGLRTAQDEADKKTKNINTRIGKNLKTIGGSLTSAGKSLTKNVTVPIVAVGAAALKTSADFDEGMSQVKAISGATESQFKALRDEAINLGKDTSFSAKEVADAMTMMAKAGWDSQQIIDGMSGVLDAAAASGESLSVVSTIVADAITGFGMAAKDSTRVADLLTKAANDGTIDINDLGESFKYIAPVANAMDMSIEDVTTALAAMSKAGIKGSQAGTSLRTMLAAMVKPTKKQAAAMEALGLEIANADGSFKSLDDIYVQLRKSMSTLTPEQQSYYATVLAGREGMSGLMAVLNMTQEEYDALGISMDKAGGIAKETAKTMKDNLKGDLEQLGGSLETAGIKLGDIFMPKLRDFIKGLERLVDKFSNLNPATQKAVASFAIFAAALGPVLFALGKMTTGVGRVFTTIGNLPKTIQMVSSTFKMMSTALSGITGPVIAVVAVIAILVAAFKHLWDTNEGFRERMSAIWEGIKEKFEAFTQGIVDRLNALGFNFEDITEVIKAVWDAFCNFLAPVFEGVFAQIETILGSAFDVITGLFDIFSGIFTGNWDLVWQGVREVFGGIWDAIVGTFTNAKEMLLGAADTILGWFGTSWNSMWTSVGDFFKNVWNNITTFFSSLKMNLEISFNNFINNIIAFFKNLPYNIGYILGTVIGTVANFVIEFVQKSYEAGMNFVNNILTFFKELPGKVSAWFIRTKDKAVTFATEFPGKAKEAAINFVNNIVTFFKELPTKVKAWFDNTVNKAKNFGSDMKQKAKESATGFKDNLVNGLKELPNKMLNIGKNIVEGIWNGIKNAKDWMEGKVKEFAKGILDGIKDSLGIHSPSTVMAKEVGKFLPPGLSNGFMSALPKALSVMKEKLNAGVKKLKPDKNISVGIDSNVGTNSSMLVNALKDKYEFLLSWFENIEQKVNKSIQGMILSLQQMQDPSLFFDGIGYVSYEGFTSPQKVKGTDRSNPKPSGNGDVYNFYSPKAIDEVEAARLLKKTKRDIAEGF